MGGVRSPARGSNPLFLLLAAQEVPEDLRVLAIAQPSLPGARPVTRACRVKGGPGYAGSWKAALGLMGVDLRWSLVAGQARPWYGGRILSPEVYKWPLAGHCRFRPRVGD